MKTVLARRASAFRQNAVFSAFKHQNQDAQEEEVRSSVCHMDQEMDPYEVDGLEHSRGGKDLCFLLK